MCWQRRRGRCGTSRENDETLCDRQRFEQHDSSPLTNILRFEPVIPQAAPRRGKRGPRPPLTNLHAPLLKILDRAGMERNRRSGGLLVLQPEILRLLVYSDHVVALVEDGLDDVIG